MAKNKLFRFAEITRMKHVHEPTIEDVRNSNNAYIGKWKEVYFKNNNPITLELGCGKGEYSVGLARNYPNRNFIGVDIKGDRIYKGAKLAEDERLNNVLFLRTKVENVDSFFNKEEVDEIWLTFSDPQPKKPNKRLTSKRFIDTYIKFLKPNGSVHLKTDSSVLFESTLEQIDNHNYKCLFSSWDIYSDIEKLPNELGSALTIRTFYEQMFLNKGKSIKYCNFIIN